MWREAKQTLPVEDSATLTKASSYLLFTILLHLKSKISNRDMFKKVFENRIHQTKVSFCLPNTNYRLSKSEHR